MFCNKCGASIRDDSQFCNSCGARTDLSPTARKISYDGSVHKCAYCGEILKSFESVCPACGNEIRDVKASSVVSELQEKLEKAPNDQQRILIISGFSIPNTKEAILEMMMLASANLDITIYIDKLHEEDVSDAWLSLLSRCYIKAKSSFGDRPEFSIAQKLYGDVQSRIEEAKAAIAKKSIELQKTKEQEQRIKEFSKSGGRKIIILLCVLSSALAILAFSFSKIISGTIALLALVSCVLSLLIGHGVIKTNRRFFIIIFAVVSVVFLSISGLLYFHEGKSYSVNTIDWQSIYLREKLPDCNITSGEVLYNRKDSVHIKCSAKREEYYDYVDACVNFGYFIDIIENENSFEAYDENGYFLALYYSDFLSEMDIKLKEPMSMENFAWSASDVAKQLPIPGSSMGKVIVDSDIEYSLYVGNITLEKYREYVDAAYNSGCNVNYSRTERTFSSEKRVWFTSFKVQIDYVGYNTIYIKIYKVE